MQKNTKLKSLFLSTFLKAACGIIVIGLITLYAFIDSKPAKSQSEIQIAKNQAVVTLPVDLTFSISASSSSRITSVSLEYGTNSQSCVTGIARQNAEFTPGKDIRAEWVWDFKTGGGSLPPGAEVWWLWEVKDESGNVVRTERKTLTVEDNRLEWHTLSNDQIKVVWSEGGTSFGKRMLKIATEAIDRLSTNAGIKPPGQIRLTVFPSQESFIDALLFVPEWAGGRAFPEYATTAMEIEVGSDPQWENNVIPHELAHLVTGQLTFNCLGAGMPTWLSEGISVYNEGPNTDIDLQAPINALENGKLPPLRNFAGGFSADSKETLLAYGYSGVIVTYMITTYGPEKLAALLEAIQSGKLINPALLSVYNFDTDGLDETWRASLGYGSGTGGTAATSIPTQLPTKVPTLALATPSFGKSGKTTPRPTATEAAQSPTIQADSTATITPAPIIDTAAPTQEPSTTLPTERPEPDSRQDNSPLTCLRGNAELATGLFAAVAFISSRRKKQQLQGD